MFPDLLEQLTINASADRRSATMFTGRGKQLTVFIGETDQYHHKALYTAIIEMLRREGCSGATVTRGVAGLVLLRLFRPHPSFACRWTCR
jgi:Uncharacterized ACR, COG1993